MEGEQDGVGLGQRVELVRGARAQFVGADAPDVVRTTVVLGVDVLVQVVGVRRVLVAEAREELTVRVPQRVHEGRDVHTLVFCRLQLKWEKFVEITVFNCLQQPQQQFDVCFHPGSSPSSCSFQRPAHVFREKVQFCNFLGGTEHSGDLRCDL